MSDLEKLMGPKPEKVIIGIREFEELKIWPMSMADQLEVGKIFDEALMTILEEVSDHFTLITTVKKIVFDNIHIIIQKATDFDTEAKAKKALCKITNDQFVEICEKIYKMNFEKISKNVLSLLGRVISLDTGRLSPTSLNDTQDTESSISQDSVTEKAA